jgi:hypothetical protein
MRMSDDILGRPQRVALRPERILVSNEQPAEGWVINDIGVVSLINEKLMAEYYNDRRKAGRAIRRQRRKFRRINREVGNDPDLGIGILRARIVMVR